MIGGNSKALGGDAGLFESALQQSFFHSAIDFARRQFWIILSTLALALGLACLYVVLSQTTYTASATMLMDPRRGGVQQKSVLGDAPSDEGWIDSQIGILMLERSQIGQAVSEKLQPGRDLPFGGAASEPEGASSPLVSRLLNKLAWQVDRTASQPSESELKARAAGTIAGGLDIKRIGLSYLVSINFTSANADEAVKIANAAADAYIQTELQRKYDLLRKASDWLLDRYEALRDQASAADRSVVEFKAKHNIVTADGKLINDQQLSEVNNRLGEVRAVVADKQARLDQIQAVLRRHDETGTVDATVSDALLNPIINRLQSQYLDILNREADWSKRYGDNHQAVINLRNQAHDIRNSTHEELNRIAESYKSDVEIAKKNEKGLEKQLNTIVSLIPNDAQIQLGALESSAQSFHTFYNTFLTTYTESIQQQTSPIPDTAVVSYASWANPNNFSLVRTILIALLGGGVLGVGLGAIRDILDRSLRTADQVRTLLHANCLALIPAVESEQESSRRALVTTQEGFGQSAIETLRLVTEAPFSRFTEAIRSIKLAADLSSDSGSKVIGLTSSVPREGKSTIAAALAVLATRGNAKVILVDCDLRKPALSRAFFRGRPGIAEVMSGKISADRAIIQDPESGLAFLPAGDVTTLPDTAQFFASNAMKILFANLRERFDYVIVDLSPLAPVVDVRATTRLLDFYVFVVEWGQTKMDVVRCALRDAEGIQNNLLGVVLNKVNMKAMVRYEGYRSPYYRNKYFADYGYAED